MLSFFSFFGVLWYGKLPKVSMYHRVTRSTLYTLNGIYNDVNSQSILEEDVPDFVRKQIITNYIDRLYKDERFKKNIGSLDIPSFDGKEISGSESVYGILMDNY